MQRARFRGGEEGDRWLLPAAACPLEAAVIRRGRGFTRSEKGSPRQQSAARGARELASTFPVSSTPPFSGKTEDRVDSRFLSPGLVRGPFGHDRRGSGTALGRRTLRRGRAEPPLPARNSTLDGAWRVMAWSPVRLLTRSGCCDLGAQELRGGGRRRPGLLPVADAGGVTANECRWVGSPGTFVPVWGGCHRPLCGPSSGGVGGDEARGLTTAARPRDQW